MSSNNIAVSVDSVSKLFRKQKQRTFKELLPALVRGEKSHDSFWAVEDISFEVKKGETLGIIGPNGSGKSTLLKLLAGVSNPSGGTITVQGKIAPLIELGAGFHPELSGKENIYLNGVILGLTRDEIDDKIGEIIDFAELHEFIDQPIKHYSSGMYLRLAFAVAIHTDPDILLIDEILAVGDERFQNKCLSMIKRMVKTQKTTLILVSHSKEQITSMCKTALYMKNGKAVSYGSANTVIARYANDAFNIKQPQTERQTKVERQKNEWGDMRAQFKEITINGTSLEKKPTFDNNQELVFDFSISNPEKLPLHLAFGLYSYKDEYLYGFNTQMNDLSLGLKSQEVASVQLASLSINTTEVILRATIYSDSEERPCHYIQEVGRFIVTATNTNPNRGIVAITEQFNTK